ncbi:uncharacterized protein [Rhodnius prolixus]|uniref:Uncharacterized protein n=1 Tax=Rhodnius prolixus TaxID=13249 RepID=T1HVR9_RHOPR
MFKLTVSLALVAVVLGASTNDAKQMKRGLTGGHELGSGIGTGFSGFGVKGLHGVGGDLGDLSLDAKLAHRLGRGYGLGTGYGLESGHGLGSGYGFGSGLGLESGLALGIGAGQDNTPTTFDNKQEHVAVSVPHPVRVSRAHPVPELRPFPVPVPIPVPIPVIWH